MIIAKSNCIYYTSIEIKDFNPMKWVTMEEFLGQVMELPGNNFD